MTSHKEGRPSVLSRDRLEQWALSLLPDPWDCLFDIGASFRLRHTSTCVGVRLWAVSRSSRAASIRAIRTLALISNTFAWRSYRVTSTLSMIRRLRRAKSFLSRRSMDTACSAWAIVCLSCYGPQRERLVAWLNASNEIELPWGNWFISRLFVNCALRACGLAYSEDRIVSDASAVESMYAGAGWYEMARRSSVTPIPHRRFIC